MNDFYLSDCSQTKTGIYLMQEGNEEPFNIRLHLAKDILTIQEQDVICVSGEPFYSSVSSPSVAETPYSVTRACTKVTDTAEVRQSALRARVGAASPLNLSDINQMQLLNNDSPPSL